VSEHTISVLFIGGSRHGELEEVHPANEIIVPVLVRNPISFTPPPRGMDIEPIARDVYRVQEFKDGSGARHFLAVYQGRRS